MGGESLAETLVDRLSDEDENEEDKEEEENRALLTKHRAKCELEISLPAKVAKKRLALGRRSFAAVDDAFRAAAPKPGTIFTHTDMVQYAYSSTSCQESIRQAIPLK